jgi:hypothetical protein
LEILKNDGASIFIIDEASIAEARMSMKAQDRY